MQKNAMRIAIIGTAGIPARYGGFETLAHHLVEQLGSRHSFTVYCSGRAYPKATRNRRFRNARLHYLPLSANGISSIPYDLLSLLHAVFVADTLLVLGVGGAILFPFIRLFTRKKIVVSIDGIEWRREKWGATAKWYLRWCERLAIRYAHADITDNEIIQDYTAGQYGTLSQLIEYGGDHATPQSTASLTESYSFARKPYAFTVCRIEPENNIHILLAAFSHLPDKQLVVVGNWLHSEYGRSLRAAYADCSHLHLLDPIYDPIKLDALRSNCHLYLHGHSAGGTNPSLVEAMWLGLPVLAFDVGFNRATTENRAIYFRSIEELEQRVRTLRYESLLQLRQQMQEIAIRRYRWEVIARKYENLFYVVASGRKKQTVGNGFERIPGSFLRSIKMGHLQYARSVFNPVQFN